MPTNPIDRRQLVRRHRVRHRDPDLLAPLTVGNGEFAFTADVTGLQTLGALHERDAARAAGRSATPLGTQAQWAYHWAPNPDGWTLADTEETYTGVRGPVRYPTRYDWRNDKEHSTGADAPGYYFWVNPQRLQLARIGFSFAAVAGGGELAAEEVLARLSDVDQLLDPWTGELSSRFRLLGAEVAVSTTVHPHRDALAVSIASELLVDRRARVAFAFPHVADTFEAEPDWGRPDAHRTRLYDAAVGAVFGRVLDGSTGYAATVGGLSAARFDADGPHRFLLDSAGADTLSFVIEFGSQPPSEQIPDADACRIAAAEDWQRFWTSGAAVDLSGSTDSRAAELERRIVLSQYQTKINCAGSTPSQETGLVCNSWSGTFHLEMHWWHAAHFAAWGRPELLERSFDWYPSILDVARETARRQGFRGARWPKHVGPEGIEHPNRIGPLLLWQQPHPIHFAELIYHARGQDPAVLTRYDEIVTETAEFLASFAYRDPAGDHRYHLPPPLVPAQEVYGIDDSWDPLFETAYVRWALIVAQQWRERQGRDRVGDWDAVIDGLRLPVSDTGRYDAVQGAPPDGEPRTEYTDHPSLLGALGVVPDTGIVDPAVMSATLREVQDRWHWPSAWGWDFPLLSMCATRLGDPAGALELLLRPENKNRYLANGHNFQVDNRMPLYLPGNGGLLMAVALLAGGWIGPDGSRVRPDPGDGWMINAEGFPPRP